mmetsp:Transcript_82188/g.207426  ORF Transcript_82188/g.207426 Transcript_82188/m.207426 type:complete len:211 (+) Transcript_82188:743-1375(+)
MNRASTSASLAGGLKSPLHAILAFTRACKCSSSDSCCAIKAGSVDSFSACKIACTDAATALLTALLLRLLPTEACETLSTARRRICSNIVGIAVFSSVRRCDNDGLSTVKPSRARASAVVRARRTTPASEPPLPATVQPPFWPNVPAGQRCGGLRTSGISEAMIASPATATRASASRPATVTTSGMAVLRMGRISTPLAIKPVLLQGDKL